MLHVCNFIENLWGILSDCGIEILNITVVFVYMERLIDPVPRLPRTVSRSPMSRVSGRMYITRGSRRLFSWSLASTLVPRARTEHRAAVRRTFFFMKVDWRLGRKVRQKWVAPTKQSRSWNIKNSFTNK